MHGLLEGIHIKNNLSPNKKTSNTRPVDPQTRRRYLASGWRWSCGASAVSTTARDTRDMGNDVDCGATSEVWNPTPVELDCWDNGVYCCCCGCGREKGVGKKEDLIPEVKESMEGVLKARLPRAEAECRRHGGGRWGTSGRWRSRTRWSCGWKSHWRRWSRGWWWHTRWMVKNPDLTMWPWSCRPLNRDLEWVMERRRLQIFL